MVSVRAERPSDREAVCAVHVAAFGGDAEAELVRRLHTDGDVLFGLVAVVEDRIVGHILFSLLPLETARGTIPAAALAPLAIAPGWQGRGIGASLVREGLARCRERRIDAVVVLGDPAYYGRFGFRADTARGVLSPWSGPYLQAIELAPGALGGETTALYPAAFSDLPSDV